ncbi:MAG: hypothetical protein E7165_03895 [Firmicutes bacterium]|nr:hypothetical protein [Bacillota bacterium]
MKTQNKENDIIEPMTQRKIISFSEIDENGIFKEAYGYLEPKPKNTTEDEEYFKKKMQEISEIMEQRRKR